MNVIENNGSYELRDGNRFVGLASENPPGTLDEGYWSVAIQTGDEGWISFGRLPSSERAIRTGIYAYESCWSYDQWMIWSRFFWPVSNFVVGLELTWWFFTGQSQWYPGWFLKLPEWARPNASHMNDPYFHWLGFRIKLEKKLGDTFFMAMRNKLGGVFPTLFLLLASAAAIYLMGGINGN